MVPFTVKEMVSFRHIKVAMHGDGMAKDFGQGKPRDQDARPDAQVIKLLLYKVLTLDVPLKFRLAFFNQLDTLQMLVCTKYMHFFGFGRVM